MNQSRPGLILVDGVIELPSPKDESVDNGDMDMTEWKVAFAELRSDVKTGISELRADLHKQDANISRWGLGTVLTIVATMVVGIGGLILQVNKAMQQPLAQTAPAAAQPPAIIINVPAPAPTRP